MKYLLFLIMLSACTSKEPPKDKFGNLYSSDEHARYMLKRWANCEQDRKFCSDKKGEFSISEYGGTCSCLYDPSGSDLRLPGDPK